eukprot:TRINITY_DN32388_c0_g1_i1.p1 TRINITY_DN32388_c0_g1~~TRINITY_DN32388_c0_g1_i1.p1  ORF type:complete len:589 (-),score=103.54 TRINITY_DN32388_c0_g1_i1:75-1622(-)
MYPQANFDLWNTPVEVLANANCIFCGVLFVDSCIRLFAFFLFSCMRRREEEDEDQNQTYIEAVAEDVGSLVHNTVMYPFTVTPIGKWAHWQWQVYEVANVTTRVMEFMVPAFYDFVISGIALYNVLPGLPFQRDFSVLTAYVSKLILIILNSLVITSCVRGFLDVDAAFEEKHAHKRSTTMVFPWLPPLVAVSVALAFFINHHRNFGWFFVALAVLFILRGVLHASPCVRWLLATIVTLMITGVIGVQQIYGCNQFDGAMGFSMGSGGDLLVGEFASDCCTFPAPPAPQPAVAHMCDARCRANTSMIGCEADGLHADCRFCGNQKTPACAAMWVGNWRQFFAPGGLSHESICSHIRILGMLMILVQALMLVIEAVFYGEVAVKLAEDEDIWAPKSWTLSFIADVLYQPEAGYEVLCYDLGIFTIALLHQINIRVPIESIRLARFVVYKTRNTIPWLNQQLYPAAMQRLIHMLKAKDATHYEERSDWYVRAERIEHAKFTASDEGMESQIETVPFS